ncbi:MULTISPECIES: hypothetical protein [unclassified Streptomyces]|uniref:hypothetical protein n=1 Tax=unclassified Streptomyces TaxID=2593676 RepID=UPI00225ABBCC|nr:MULTISPECIES: hypothetical protein [unclassified Streptomyces]MCX5010275.1 hypothetical protein [Streptomyces sp. NBC_00555]MCX5610698.1 hypothetical protein [Streptomyces sp. NBC_00047]
MDTSLLAHVEAVVGEGKAVFSADDEAVVAFVQEAIRSGRTASFFLSREQARILRSLHWTPERVKASRLEPVSSEEKSRIESELGLGDIGYFRFADFACKNGHTFSAYDFLKEGIREHGVDAVKAIFELKNAAFLRVNPHFVVTCPDCDQTMAGGIEYEGDTYPGCSYPDPPVRQ